jgi:hypothetical protein
VRAGTLYARGTLDGNGELVFGSSSFNALKIFIGGSEFTIGPNITIHGHRGTIGSALNPKVTNDGTIQADVSGGTITLQASGVSPGPEPSWTNRGTIEALNGGSLRATGSITNSGHVNPGTLGGAFDISKDYAQTVTGTLSVDIGGLTAGTDFGQLTISGLATLTGTLNIALINSYEPDLGDSFEIMTFGSRSGEFTSINGLEIGNGKRFEVIYSGTSLTLEVMPAP